MTDTDFADSPFPFMDWMGFHVEVTDDGVGRAAIEIGARHMNPNGVAHGAVAYALIDTAMGGATMAVVEEGKHCATIEIHVRYHRGGRAGRLTAEATVISASRRVVHLEARAIDDEGTLVASATGSFAVIG